MATSMHLRKMLFFLFSFLVIIPTFSSPIPCTSNQFSNAKHYVACTELNVLDSGIHWTYYPSSNKVDVAFRKNSVKQSSWVAWAINPTSTGMIGSQAVVAFRRSDGTMTAYTSPITAYRTQLQQGNLSFALDGVSATYENGVMTIFLTLTLPGNSTLVHHVWQEGPVVDNVPGMHALSGPNLQSFGSLDFASGNVAIGGSDSRTKLKLVWSWNNQCHQLGYPNASWGYHCKICEILQWRKSWFYIHVTCQCTAYFVGVAGFITGIYLGEQSKGIQHSGHRCIGITLVCLATAQVLVGRFLRPKKDHKYRIFWNCFHYVIGYGTIALGITNVFIGLSLLTGYKDWKHGYIGIVVALGSIAILLEVFTWVCTWRRRTKKSAESIDV